MGAITLPGPSQLWVSWSCRRCGHTGGVARTTIPVDDTIAGEVMARLLEDGRRKVAQKHMLRQGCIAVPEDIVLARYIPTDKEIKGFL